MHGRAIVAQVSDIRLYTSFILLVAQVNAFALNKSFCAVGILLRSARLRCRQIKGGQFIFHWSKG